MGDTAISWTHRPGTRGRTWNPTNGCKVVSPGCANCYAMRFAGRFSAPGQRYHGLVTIAKNKRAVWTGEGRLEQHMLDLPLRWRSPSTVFVNSMSDLFYEGFSNEQIAAVFGIAAACPQHTFQCLTKRSRRMLEWFRWLDEEIESEAQDHSGADCSVSIHDARAEERAGVLATAAAVELSDGSEEDHQRWYGRLSDAIQDGWARTGEDGGTEWTMPWPLPNWWQGVSVENQDAADERIPELLATPAAVRFLSCEPLIGEVDLDMPRCDGAHCGPEQWGVADDEATPWCSEHDQERSYGHWLHLDGGIDWVIAGCESGPGARLADPAWFRALRDQCVTAGVPFFLKQAREKIAPLAPDGSHEDRAPYVIGPGPGSKLKAGGVIELPYLDGVQHAAFPEVSHG